MTETGTDSTTITWSVPECPFIVESSARVLDDIRLSVVDAFFSLPRGGAEIGGILLGTYHSGRLIISDHAALDCEHAHGPSFTLSPPDEARLTELLSANGHGALRPVGWYHSHTRTEIFLSDADLEIHRRFFPEPWQVALVMKPHTFQPARFGFFFREGDGSMRASASYREDELAALPLRQIPAGAPTAPHLNDLPPRRLHPDPVPTPRPELDRASSPAIVVEHTPSPVPPPAEPEAAVPSPPPDAETKVPSFRVESASSARRWMVAGIGIVATLGVLGAGFQTRQMWLPQALALVRPAPAVPPTPPSLGLNTIDREGQLQIIWDRNSLSVRRASDAILEIIDGGPLPVAIQLDSAHLQAGSFTYARNAEKVDVELIIHQKNGPDLHEVTSFLGKLPGREPAEDPAEAQKQREAMAKQAAKLKADLSFQAAKTKKLERDLQTMREELRQQQLRRLTNQAPSK